jgi:hypothetical protein
VRTLCKLEDLTIEPISVRKQHNLRATTNAQSRKFEWGAWWT